MGSVKVCEFCGLQSSREKLSSDYLSETAFPKTEQLKVTMQNHKECTVSCQFFCFNRVYWPLATVRVAPLYQMCRGVA